MGWGYAKVPLSELTAKTKHPVVCGNCHDPATMDLRVINPAFVEAMGRRGIDLKKAGRQCAAMSAASATPSTFSNREPAGWFPTTKG